MGKRKDRIRLIDGNEYSMFTGWRHIKAYWTRGFKKLLKRQYNKRLRKEAKHELSTRD